MKSIVNTLPASVLPALLLSDEINDFWTYIENLAWSIEEHVWEDANETISP